MFLAKQVKVQIKVIFCSTKQLHVRKPSKRRQSIVKTVTSLDISAWDCAICWSEASFILLCCAYLCSVWFAPQKISLVLQSEQQSYEALHISVTDSILVQANDKESPKITFYRIIFFLQCINRFYFGPGKGKELILLPFS